jgi:hypothetical protein
MKLPQIVWDPLPYDRFAARFAGGAIAVMFCSGLLLQQPWFAQITTWMALLPGGIWLMWLTGRPAASAGGSIRYYWITVTGTACYLAVLIISTAAAGLEGEEPFEDQLWAAALCVVCVAFLGLAHRRDQGFARYFGRWIAVAASVASLMLIAAAWASDSFAYGRMHGVPALNWFLNPNAVGGVYAATFAVVVGHGLRRRISTRERLMTFAAALLPLAIVLLTQSRGAMLGCAAAMLVAVIALPWRLSLTLCGLAAVAGAAVLIADPRWFAILFSRGDSHRLVLWQHYLELSRDRLWLGRGLDFDVKFALGNETIHTPHNILLAALVRGGLPGLASLAVALIGAVLASLTAARQGWWMPITVLATSLAASMVDHEMIPTEFGFYWYLFWLPLGLAAAAALAPTDPGDT